MKKTLIILLFILLGSASFARDKVNLQLDLGGFGPKEDKVFSKYYEPGFFVRGSIGYELDNGWEFKGSLGTYQDETHQPATPNLYGEKLFITPLTFSAIYHVNNKSSFHPYFGGGLGAYFWSVENDLFDDLESGTKFGTHALAGFKWNINSGFYINAQYEKHFLDKFWLDNAKNVNSDAYTFGIGFVLPVSETNTKKSGYSNKSHKKYRFSENEEKLLVKINAQERKIRELEFDREDIEEELDQLYDTKAKYGTPKYEAIQNKISNLERKLRRIERQIRREEDKLEDLETKWDRKNRDNTPVREHVQYLNNNYYNSPYGLRHNNGVFWYDDNNHDHTTIIYNDSEPTKTQTEQMEEKKEYLDKKREYINKIKQRK